MEKINIAELLKDCPEGMELDCLMFDNLVFSDVDEGAQDYPIEGRLPNGVRKWFTSDGRYELNENAKCVIFPKGKTTWEGFVPPCNFKDGDFLTYHSTVGTTIFIHRNKKDERTYRTSFYVGLNGRGKLLVYDKYTLIALNGDADTCPATEEEKEKLLQAIKDNGYRWNPETKTLEKLTKLKFKVGDYVIQKGGITVPVLITGVGNDYYYSNMGNSVGIFSIKEQDDWELAPNKFDINTLKPLESKVLMRSSNAREWVGTIYSHYNNNKFYGCGMYCDQCIPYEGNEHLLGTTNDCDDYYKNW